ncbi:MAG: glucose-6-phosphate isomerase [Firmicutes bacterium]|nr:glucose-6-phosphate isomerase [Bacillota bacterium]
MIDLSRHSGLPISWDRSGEKLVFGEGLLEVKPDIRCREEMAEVLYEPRAMDLKELYFMYREVARREEREEIRRRGLRYDITVIKPGLLGSEYIKTAGHYHPFKPGTGLTYPEVYEVLYGRGHYLLQCPSPDGRDRLEQIYLMTAGAGEKVLVPPGFGHITINAEDDLLIMSNWVAADFASVYEPMRSMEGGGYFGLRIDGRIEFVPNSRYRQLPPLQRASGFSFAGLSLVEGMPIYQVYQKDPGALDYLVDPENYREQFAAYLALVYPDD